MSFFSARRFTLMVSGLLTASALSATALAAPHPGASVLTPKSGQYRSPLGFEVNAAKSGWSIHTPPRDSKFVATVFRPSAASSAALTVRVDKLDRDLSIDQYIQRWMKEYPRFGFDVLGSQPFQQASRKGYVVDLINRESQRQLRQVIFLSNKRRSAVILTCRDKVDRFKDSMRNCNSIVRTFNWKE
jgi:hypothetical protein